VAERDELRHERKRERERERRLENKDGKRSKMTRDAERDVSERIALGQAVPNSTEVGEPPNPTSAQLAYSSPFALAFPDSLRPASVQSVCLGHEFWLLVRR
jgi:hypothetical protein